MIDQQDEVTRIIHEIAMVTDSEIQECLAVLMAAGGITDPEDDAELIVIAVDEPKHMRDFLLQCGTIQPGLVDVCEWQEKHGAAPGHYLVECNICDEPAIHVDYDSGGAYCAMHIGWPS